MHRARSIVEGYRDPAIESIFSDKMSSSSESQPLSHFESVDIDQIQSEIEQSCMLQEAKLAELQNELYFFYYRYQEMQEEIEEAET